MKCTKIEPVVPILVKKIVDQIDQKGGRALLVGGAVRDLLLDSIHPEEHDCASRRTKDLDIEVHGITIDELQSILSQFGQVSLVGKAFGVLRLHGLDIDWSLPRKDSSGRHPQVAVDPHMSLPEAFKRRDLTINAMGIDLKTHELIDPWGGQADLQNGILRAPDEKLFVEDPLRLFRVMQFIGRFGMKPDAQLHEICKNMSLKGISVERIESEIDKLFLKSKRPSLGIRWLKDIGRLTELFPELAATIGVAQEPDWHPEGDVFEHTMQSIDAAAQISYDSTDEKLMAIYGVLCHDLGKVTTTKIIDGRLRSLGHEDAGVPLATAMMKRFTRRIDLIHAVAKLVKNHMAPVAFIKTSAKLPAYKRLAMKLAPEANIQLLAKVSLADRRGRNGNSSMPLTDDIPEIAQFLSIAEKALITYKPEDPVLQGRDLMGIVEPGPHMGVLLKHAYEIQIEQGIKDKQELLKRIL